MALPSFKFVALIALITICGTFADIDDNEVQYSTHMFQGVKVYSSDRECAMVGGLCVHTNDCLESTSVSGLCRSNLHLGVECCYELPVRPAPCREHLGACRDRCPSQLVRPGIDCKEGEFCCVLV